MSVEGGVQADPRFLVTGATGFIGAHVVRALLARGCAVTAVFRDEARARAQDWFGRVTLLRADVEAATPEQLSMMAKHGRILHLAWGHLNSFKAEAHVTEVFPKHFEFLRQLVARGAKHLLVAGTCLEYGLQSGALREDLPASPVTAYGQGKDMLRRALEPLCQARGTRLTWARLFYMHGPGQSEKSLLSQLDRAINSGAPEFNMSGGMQLRDYLPVEEVAEILVRLAEPGLGFGVVNCASGKPVSVLNLVQSHLRGRGADLLLNLGHYPYPDYEPMEFWGDTTKLAAALAASPD
ncbi:MAG: NAD-dependent epimerase/dehydratase family protein [Humidesulfovibrio sp.]|nr:NAD-dependent epimerase/dehydratase family protein [Humidesulfovibrio sp.]